jgi:pre-mRNA-processing factor 40
MKQVKDHSTYQAVASNTSGSTPKELFDDLVEELDKQYHDDKARVKDTMKAGKISVGATWTFDKFKAAIAEAGDLAAIAEPNLKVSDKTSQWLWLSDCSLQHTRLWVCC